MTKETLFAPYRPLCAALASQPSPSLLFKLQELINSEKNDETLQILQDYLIFPHQVYLRHPSRPENYTIATLNVVTGILKRVHIDSSFLFKDLLSILMKLELNSEDSKVALVNCLRELFRSAALHQVIAFEEENHRYELSHVIFTVLSFLEETENNDLIRSCLCALNSIMDVYLPRKNLLQPMVPGLLSKLIKIMNKRQMKSRARSECISLWNRVFSKIFLSDFRADDIKSLNHVSTHLNQILPHSYSELVLVRDSAYEVFQSVKSVDYFLTDAVEFAASILSRKEVDCVKDFINEENHSRIQAHVFAQIHSMTEIFDDVEVYRLLGFLRLLHLLEKSYQFFKSESYQKPFLRTMLRLGRVETNKKVSYAHVKSEAVHFEYSLSDVDSLFQRIEDSHLPEKEYVYLKYDQISVYKQMCEILSNSPAIDDFVSHLIGELKKNENDQTKRDCLSLIPMIVQTSMSDFVFEELLDVLIQFECYHDEVCVCLISMISKATESIRWNYMSEVLSYVLTRTQDRTLISFALNSFATIESAPSIVEFLASYSRPLSQTLFIRLRKLQTEEVPLILLSIVLKLENNSSELRDVFSILLSQLDISWLSSDKSFTTKILQIIKTSIEHLELSEGYEDKKSQLDLKKRSNFEDGALTHLIQSLLNEEQETLELMESEPTDDNLEDATVEEEDLDESEVKISLEQSYLRECILHTRHFVSMVRCPRWQILSMEIIVHCIQVANLPEDELLPLVHQVWQPLKLLFESDNIFVVDRAFSLLNTLALTSKDFIRKRSEQDVFPHIMKYLTRLRSLKTSSKEGLSLLIVKQADKLLKKMLKGLWNFTALLDLDEKSVGKLMASLDLPQKEEGALSPLRDLDEDVLYYYCVLKGKIK